MRNLGTVFSLSSWKEINQIVPLYSSRKRTAFKRSVWSFCVYISSRLSPTQSSICFVAVKTVDGATNNDVIIPFYS